MFEFRYRNLFTVVCMACATVGAAYGIAFAEDVGLTIHPHPTLGEAVMESFKHALGEAVHVLNKK